MNNDWKFLLVIAIIHLTFNFVMRHRTFMELEPYNTNIYLLGKGGYVFGSVGLSVCLRTTLLKKL